MKLLTTASKLRLIAAWRGRNQKTYASI